MNGNVDNFTDEESKEFLEELLDCSVVQKELSDEVHEDLTIEDKLEFFRKSGGCHSYSWETVGNIENNESVTPEVDNWIQAIREDIANGEDAVLRRVEEETDYLNGASTAEEIAEEMDDEEIYLIFEGYKGGGGGRKDFSTTVVDTGAGQPQNNFKHAFVNSTIEIGLEKQEKEYPHGKFGKGSLAPLKFADNGYKLIASASHNNPQEWSYTLLRKEEGSSCAEYLTINGDIPTFSGKVENPAEPKNSTDEIEEELEHGTIVKTYGMGADDAGDVQGNVENTPNNVTNAAFTRRLERACPEMHVPTVIQDHRNTVESYTTLGLINHAREHESVQIFEETANFDGFGKTDITVLLIDSEEERQRLHKNGVLDRSDTGSSLTKFETSNNDDSILFTVDGHTHETASKNWISDAGFDELSEQLIIICECSEFDNLRDVFKNNRTAICDRYKDSLKEEIQYELKNMGLSNYEEKRRKELLDSSFGIEEINLATNSVEITPEDPMASLECTINGVSKAWEQNEINITVDGYEDNVDIETIDKTTFELTIHPQMKVGENKSFILEVTHDDYTRKNVDSFNVNCARTDTEEVPTKTDTTNEISRIESNLVQAIYTFHEIQSNNITDRRSTTKNRMNRQGENLEEFVKDLFTGSPLKNGKRSNILAQELLWEGDSSTIPDCIPHDSYAIEIKKKNSRGTRIQLNSSYPHRVLHSSEPKDPVPTESWDTKEFMYTIGTVTNSQIDDLWMIDGRCWAEPKDLYLEREGLIQAAIRNYVNMKNRIGLISKTTDELGKIKNVGNSNEASLRSRPMWSMNHPREYYDQFTDGNPTLTTIIPKEKYEQFTSTDKELLKNKNRINIEQLTVDPLVCEKETEVVCITVE